jgi:glutathionylspermidine synthase
MAYVENRKQFYSAIPEYWSDLYGDEYSLFHAFCITPQELDEIKRATQKLGLLFFKTAKLLRKMNDQVLLELGFPEEVLPFLRLKTISPETIISRFDFVKKGSQIKMLEFNSDTPTFIKECFFINGVVAKHFHQQDPNVSELNLLKNAVSKAIIESIKTLEIEHFPNVVFTAHDDHPEDWLTSKFLSEIIDIPNKLVPLNQLTLINDTLVDADGLRIDILYRQTYPLEYLIEDLDDQGNRIGIKLLELVKSKKLALLNPISSFLLQSKALQALIWGLREERTIFTVEESSIIEQYMLPTYLEPEPFLNSSSFVQKPIFGREGDTVTIYDSSGQVSLKNKHQTYVKELPIYQEYIDLPTLKIETEKGMETLSYLFGSFFIAGNASAVGIRAGGKITANESYFLPIGIKKNTLEV